MKINAPNTNGLALNVDKANTAKLEAEAAIKFAKLQAEPTVTAAKENVSLSTMSAQLRSLEDKIATANVFDAKKVDAIKSAITKGQFKVDSEKVAEGLIETVKDLLNPQNRQYP